MQLEVGAITEGTVVKVMKFGALVRLPSQQTGMIHISQVDHAYVEDITTYLHIGDPVTVKVIGMETQPDGKVQIALSRKAALPPKEPPRTKSAASEKPVALAHAETDPFEEMMRRFKTRSEERISDWKKSMDHKQRGASRRRK